MVTLLLVHLLAMPATAQEPLAPGLGEGDVISADSNSTDTFSFTIQGCDRVRAVALDERPPHVERSEKVVVTLQNQSASMCLYRGLSLQGFLAGEYDSSLRNPEGTGFFIPPGGRISFRVDPASPHLPRGAVQLQIPPDSGTIILIGVAPDRAPPPSLDPAHPPAP